MRLASGLSRKAACRCLGYPLFQRRAIAVSRSWAAEPKPSSYTASISKSIACSPTEASCFDHLASPVSLPVGLSVTSVVNDDRDRPPYPLPP